MNTKTKRATIYLDYELHKALRIKATETEHSKSEMVNISKNELQKKKKKYKPYQKNRNHKDHKNSHKRTVSNSTG